MLGTEENVRGFARDLTGKIRIMVQRREVLVPEPNCAIQRLQHAESSNHLSLEVSWGVSHSRRDHSPGRLRTLREPFFDRAVK